MSKLITDKWSYRDSSLTAFDQDDEAGIRDLLLGHSVAKIADDHMELDDGTVVKIVPNEGCGGCTAGWYELTDLNECDNVITRVEFVQDGEGDGFDYETIYRVFVVAEDKRINLYAVTGDDGNGYYGTGYELLVRKA